MTAAPDPPTVPRDPGLQPERTELAWYRTLLAMLVVSGVFLRWLPSRGLVALLPTIAVILLLGAELATRRSRVARLDAAILHGRTVPPVVPVAVLAGLVIAMAATSLVLIQTAGR